MLLNQFLILGAVLFATGVYGVLARRNGVMVLMSIELMLLGVNINFIAFSYYTNTITGQVFSLFILTVVAAEAAIGLAILVVYFRNKGSIDVKEINLLKG